MANIAVTGVAGRMGKTLVEACANASGADLSAAIERAGGAMVGADAGDVAGLGANGIKIVHGGFWRSKIDQHVKF